MKIVLRWGIRSKHRSLQMAMPRLFGSLFRMTCQGNLPLKDALAELPASTPTEGKGQTTLLRNRRRVQARLEQCFYRFVLPQTWNEGIMPTEGHSCHDQELSCFTFSGVDSSTRDESHQAFRQASGPNPTNELNSGEMLGTSRGHFELLKYTAVACARRVTCNLSYTFAR